MVNYDRKTRLPKPRAVTSINGCIEVLYHVITHQLLQHLQR